MVQAEDDAMQMGIVDYHIYMESMVDFFMDADEILGFDYSCFILFGLIGAIPLAALVVLRFKRRSGYP